LKVVFFFGICAFYLYCRRCSTVAFDLRIISLKLNDAMSVHKFVAEFEIEMKFLIYEIVNNQKY
jgi:hypothetical protein